jgi:hypothetical protein
MTAYDVINGTGHGGGFSEAVKKAMYDHLIYRNGEDAVFIVKGAEVLRSSDIAKVIDCAWNPARKVPARANR